MVQYAYYQNSLGLWKIGYEDGFLTSLKQTGCPDTPSIPSSLSDSAARQLQEYLSGQRTSFDLPVKPAGTAFQRRVWEALLRIPWAERRTYGQIARDLGNPGASRAVGQAANKNPIWIIIPCHRLVGKDNSLTGYAGGIALKQTLLDLEQQKSPEI